MIEILDKVNNRYKEISDNISMVIHPLSKEETFLNDVQLDGYKIIGIIFKEDGSTEFLYKNLKKDIKVEK